MIVNENVKKIRTGDTTCLVSVCQMRERADCRCGSTIAQYIREQQQQQQEICLLKSNQTFPNAAYFCDDFFAFFFVAS